MKTLDRIVFGAIAVALLLISLKPYMVDARREFSDVNIAAIGGKTLSYGDSIRVVIDK